MKHLYVPWRQKYSKENKNENTKKECPFCRIFSQDKSEDRKNFILKRFKHSAVVLNLYPYNAGHLMVIPLKHSAQLNELPDEALNEIMQLTSKSCEILQKELNAQGINIGLNLGRDAGAGVPNHLHMHVLPRWQGDTNFMALLAETKPISFDLNEIYNDLISYFDSIKF
jgi:ATP adenylyltransferase